MTQRNAIILFNLGGPDTLEAVRPFLFNLFSDKAIIRLPRPFRLLLAQLISRRREKTAQAIYAQMGGSSPILQHTQAQAQALDDFLKRQTAGMEWKSFISMRYWHPMIEQTVAEVSAWNPDSITLLPLYPQFSTTTTASSFALWHETVQGTELENIPTSSLCCYPTESHFISGHVATILEHLTKQEHPHPPRLLFSAHGLPEKIVKQGDPYVWQIEQTVAAIMEHPDLQSYDHRICYQSRVGPMKWIGPSTEEEITKAGQEQQSLAVIPIAFVSEHSETLVELDIEYRHKADLAGVPSYSRVPALGTHKRFITSLAEMCIARYGKKTSSLSSHTGHRLCPSGFTACPCRKNS